MKSGLTYSAFIMAICMAILHEPIIDTYEMYTLSVGDVWTYQANSDNPFSKSPVRVNRVIDLKGDYVLFVQNEEDTISTTRRWFIIGSKKYKR